MAPEHVIVLAHGGTAGAVAEATFLALPVVLFFLLSRWSKRRARKAGLLENGKAPRQGKGDKSGGSS